MVIIHKQNIVDMVLMETFAELHQVSEKLRFFQEKYHQDFEKFSIEIKGEEENFEHYDDYIEWKAYTQLLRDLNQKIEDLKHGNLQVT
jgi:hypothetical protein